MKAEALRLYPVTESQNQSRRHFCHGDTGLY